MGAPFAGWHRSSASTARTHAVTRFTWVDDYSRSERRVVRRLAGLPACGRVPFRVNLDAPPAARCGACVSAVHVGPCAYICLDAAGRALYVGSTENHHRRLTRHRKNDWWAAVARVVTIRCETREAAFVREADLIDALRPPHNRRTGVRSYRDPSWRSLAAVA